MATTVTPARPAPLPPAPGVVPLTRRELAELTRRWADRLRAGELGAVRYGDPARPGDPGARWHVRVHADAVVDVWVISWLPTQGTQLHDHGGSAGAFTVVEGELTEAVWSPSGPAGGVRRGTLGDRRHDARATVAFGTDHVHDVRNLGHAPAVSVHAYSHPLTRMGYYDLADGSLQLTSVLDTTDPEPES